MFSSTVPITALIPWCRALRHGLGVGLSPPHVFRQQATRGPMALRAVAARVAERLEAGESLADALAPERDRFPTLFLDMVGIGESTGHLPEVCGELENYCTLQLQMRRKFISEITWPAFQFVVAILVIALLIWVLGMIAEAHNTEAIAPVGMGLTGAAGAVTFLMTAVAVVAGVYFGYRFLSRNVGRWAAVEAFLLRVPGIGPCLDALAMQRFCLSLRLTTEVGLPVHEAVRRSLRSTGNAAFIRAEDRAARALRSGRDLTTTL
ncbi:MAG TPA: type II secretion system F family protein, partial [Gemmataceae bacterium]